MKRYSPSAGKSVLEPRAAPRTERHAVHIAILVAGSGGGKEALTTSGTGLPTAMRETARATLTYCSRKAGDTVNAAAMLLKPSTAMSAGRYWLGSISTARRSFTALAYSVRFKRWTGTRPARCALLLSSSVLSSQPISASTSCCEGWGMPGGGIWRPRNLRTAFSKISGCSGTDSALKLVQKEVTGVNVLVVATEAVESEWWTTAIRDAARPGSRVGRRPWSRPKRYRRHKKCR